MSAKTIYAKEFPATTTIEALQEFFEGFGVVENICMRKNEKKAFMGSVYVTFADDESVKKFLEPESIKFGETELEKRMTKFDYYQMKKLEMKEKTVKQVSLTDSHITEDTATIAETQKKSTTNLLEIHSDKTKSRRSPHKPIPGNRRQEMSARTIYAKEFPATTTPEALQEFFEGFGKVENICMRKNEKKAFMGSVYVTFADDESVKKFLEPESVKFGETELEKRMTKYQYYDMKRREIKEKTNKQVSLTDSHITEDTATIAETQKKSTTNLLEIHSDHTKSRRSPDEPIPDNRRQEMSAKTIYAKEFPATTTPEALQEFFEGFGKVENICMRKNEKKAFMGSVYVTFADDESVKKFLEPESVKFGETELEKRMTKSDYDQFKKGENGVKELSAHHRQLVNEVQINTNEIPHGTILCLTKICEGTSLKQIEELIKDYARFQWIEFKRGETEAFVRYYKENEAKEVLEKALAAMNNEIMLNGNKLEARVLEGEEEDEKLRKMEEDKKRNLRKKRRSKSFQRSRWQRKGKREREERRRKLHEDGANYTESEENGKGDSKQGISTEPPEKKMKFTR